MARPQGKKIIACCDGTWQNADAGYTKPTLIPYHPYGVLQVPSNVVRISRALKRQDFNGNPQIVYYQAGVGSSESTLDKITGGLMGTGISENIREAYSFITANYMPGDQIILIGFSRGAFTARSIAGLISDIGLLTREGMADFYAIFRDIENSKNKNYRDIFPTIPFPNKPRGPHAMEEYKRRLADVGIEWGNKFQANMWQNRLTRLLDPDGTPIVVHGVAVWDTVGSLGIPTIGWLQRMGIPHATKELKFYDTALSNTILHAFQALALDEHRGPFSPTVWERREEDGCNTDLRQVWFPGAHSNVGGGYDDQEIANVTLAWMMDQLSSIGVEFQHDTINRIFEENRQYYETHPFPRNAQPWAIPSIYEKHKPVRPWGLGKIYNSDIGFYVLAGKISRTPGQYMRADADTGNPTKIPMTNTNERIHSSVRIRLDLQGLGLDDNGLYNCPALLAKGNWELRQVHIKVRDPIHRYTDWGEEPTSNGPAPESENDPRWVWQWVGPRKNAPPIRTMIEENLGPYERHLLSLNTGRYGQRRRRRRRRKKSHDG